MLHLKNMLYEKEKFTITESHVCLIFESQRLRSTSTPLHLERVMWDFIIPEHCPLLGFVSYFPYNNIIFSQSSTTVISLHIKITEQLTEKTYCVSKYILCSLAVPRGKTYTCSFHIGFLQNTWFCNTYIDWLQRAIAVCIQL